MAALFALSAPWCGTASAATPSFDCAAAAAPIEILICGHDELATADAALADTFRDLLAGLEGEAKASLLAEQRQWLKARFATCGIPTAGKTLPTDADKAAACLIGVYKERLAGLKKRGEAGAPTKTVAPIEGQLPTALGLEQGTVPATGDQQTLLSVAAFGRYAVTVKSAQGVALQLVDRMAGPGPVEGVAGEKDGRVDAFLDRGVYKILLQADEQGSGEAALSVHPFAELNGPEMPRLPEIRRIDTDLGDFQQRSYWLEISSRRVVAIEAAGRNLSEMRLWRDGNWLVDAVPVADQVEPEPGKPLAVRRIVTMLEPGLYLLSAYGGPDLPWAKTSDEHPLHMRMGIPTIAEAGRETFTTSPFGIDRFLVPAKANYFRIELPEAEAADLFVNDYSEAAPFEPGQHAEITKKSVPPIAEIRATSRDIGFKVVTIRREAGKPYVLQRFKAVETYYFDGSGDYWIATLHSGYGEDSVDATGLLTKHGPGTPEEIINSNAPELDGQSVWKRRFNLLEPVTVYFHVTRTGKYVVTSSGAEAEYRFEPMIHLGINYKPPKFQPSGAVWDLDPGYYILSGQPVEDGKGILDIRVAAQGNMSEGGDQAKETTTLFQRQELFSSLGYTLYLNQQPGVEAGVVLRRLPIDLQPGLPLVLKAGQSLDIPVRAPEGGLVTAVAEDASALKFTIDRGAPMTEWRGDGKEHTLSIANATDQAFNAALRYMPDDLAPHAPLAKVPAETLASIPTFPPLVPEQPAYFDIAKTEQRTFALDVAEAGLYRVESTGLLQGEGNMRSRTVISLDRQANNGTGRNFLLQQYLGQGHYQVSVAAQGETHGRMGVVAARTELMDGGALSLGVPARDTIASGNGLVYTFDIAAAGRYRLQALGLGRTYLMRLEDQDGWPIIAPNAPADLAMDFEPGHYRLVILPQPVEAKIVTLLERISEPAAIEGHGPHDLVLNQPQDFQWQEPEAGAARVPDQWRFTLPAAAHVTIDLSRGMRADLLGEDGKARNEVIGGESWSGELPTGTHTLRATTLEPNNRFDYTVSVAAQELVAGRSLVTNLPADIPVSIGSDAVVEIGSFGVTDVRAWLYDAKDKLVATNDDRPNDWNFAIAGRLQPGYYKLHLEAVGKAPPAPQPAVTDTVEDGENDQMISGDSEEGEEEPTAAPVEAEPGQTTVSIYQAEEQSEPALAVGKDIALSGPKVHLVPLTGAAGDVLVAAADAAGPAVGLGLERQENDQWRTISENVGRSPWVAVSVKGIKGTYRLRVWSVDRNTDPIRLQTRAASPASAPSKQFGAGGVPLTPIAGIEPALGLAAVTIDAAGAYRLAQPEADLAWSTENGRPLAGDPLGVVFGNKGTFWFGARLTDAAAKVSGKLVVPGAGVVALTVPGSDHGASVVADPVAGKGLPHLWLVESRLGQPGIGAKGLVRVAAEQSAVAVSMSGQDTGFALRLWNAGDPVTPLPLTLRRIDFAAPAKAAVDWGVADRGIKSHQALAFALPKGLKRLNLALPPLTAVILRDGSSSEGIWSGNTPLALARDSTADQVLVLSAAETDGQIGLSLTPIVSADAATTLGGGRIFKQYFPAEGVVRLDIRLSDAEKNAAGTLRVMTEGVAKQMMLHRNDGTVSDAARPLLNGNATLDLAHGAGLVVAWIDGGDPLTSLGVAAQGIQVKETSSVQLAGAAQQIVFAVAEPKFLRLKTTTPVIAELEAPQRLKVFADGADLSLLLPKGTTPVVLRAAGEGLLSGIAEASLIDIAPIDEGLGPKVRLAPGESRLYSFTVKDERDIGVGVRGATDSAHCRVLDAEGSEIGSGVVQMLHLKAGTYLLAVDAPAQGTAIEVQPALVGVAGPDGSPPDDVKRGYLELAGLKPQTQTQE
ncbi:lysozyme inhibitor LprI family protein [Dongia sedimenti]|uniref:Lysozyme inhibitor LprI family protein n=1 Tax=Dongia sedimenti TaxID=3064282 RepID=A0ABU0YF92_9PROT|nr:lysozyme inhibitor LprI family protein [Rhodospirillaceae bacterium R-7]